MGDLATSLRPSRFGSWWAFALFFSLYLLLFVYIDSLAALPLVCALCATLA